MIEWHRHRERERDKEREIDRSVVVYMKKAVEDESVHILFFMFIERKKDSMKEKKRKEKIKKNYI